jgi:hypothetical protein
MKSFKKYCFCGLILSAGFYAVAQSSVSSKGDKNVNVNTNYGLIVQTNVTESSEKAKQIRKEERQSFGIDRNWQTTLVPGSDKLGYDPDCKPSPGALAIHLGSDEAGNSTVICAKDECKAVETPDTTLIEIDRHGKTVQIEARVFGPDGKIVAEIDKGTLYINRNNAFRWSRLDAHSIQVFDQEDNKVLFVRFANPESIVVEGIFYDRSGHRMEIRSN